MQGFAMLERRAKDSDVLEKRSIMIASQSSGRPAHRFARSRARLGPVSAVFYGRSRSCMISRPKNASDPVVSTEPDA